MDCKIDQLIIKKNQHAFVSMIATTKTKAIRMIWQNNYSLSIFNIRFDSFISYFLHYF